MHRLWWPDIPPKSDLDPQALLLANDLEHVWGLIETERGKLEPMRQINPEWDFMGRTFFILGQAYLALRVPERKMQCLRASDARREDTLAMETKHGMTHFLLSYHSRSPWVQQPPRSVFVDGEIALC